MKIHQINKENIELVLKNLPEDKLKKVLVQICEMKPNLIPKVLRCTRVRNLSIDEKMPVLNLIRSSNLAKKVLKINPGINESIWLTSRFPKKIKFAVKNHEKFMTEGGQSPETVDFIIKAIGSIEDENGKIIALKKIPERIPSILGSNPKLAEIIDKAFTLED
jgi:hypothetical protein